MKRYRTILALCMAVAMVFSMAVTASAATMPTVDESEPNKVSSAGGKATIPVNISADATQLDVTVPTAFPIAVDHAGNVTVAETAPKIVNGSYGAIVVSNIIVKDNATDAEAATWHLAAFDTDMTEEKVDANKVGLAVAPKGGKSGADGTAFLKTDGSNAAAQTLLDAVDAKWVINGATDAGDTDELSVVYDANVSAVSAGITDETVANIVITIGWYTAEPVTPAP